jgi:hypothetical protein
MKREDIAPPYTEVARHGVFPTPSHDEAARFNFLANLNKYVSGVLGQGNALAMSAASSRPSSRNMAASRRTGSRSAPP